MYALLSAFHSCAASDETDFWEESKQMKKPSKKLYYFWTTAIVVSLLLVLFSLIFVSCSAQRAPETDPAPTDDVLNSDGTPNAPDAPNVPDGSDTPDAPDAPNAPDGSDTPNTPPTNTPDVPNTPNTPAPEQNSTRLTLTEDMGQEYLDKFFFLGDSTTYGLGYYNIVNKNQVWTPKSGTLTLDQWNYVAILNPETGEELMFTDLIALKQPEYLMITLGVNGISFMEEDYFKESYTSLVQKAQELSPNTKIILNSIYPVTTGYEAKKNGINNLKISAANLWVESVASTTGVYYLDSASVLKNAEQVLPDEYTNGDGLHLNETSFALVVEYIRKHGC